MARFLIFSGWKDKTDIHVVQFRDKPSEPFLEAFFISPAGISRESSCCLRLAAHFHILRLAVIGVMTHDSRVKTFSTCAIAICAFPLFFSTGPFRLRVFASAFALFDFETVFKPYALCSRPYTFFKLATRNSKLLQICLKS